MKIPALVDLQVNGFKGVSFSDPGLTEEGFAAACGELLTETASAFLPTVITSGVDVYRRNLPLIAKAMGRAEFAGRLLGIHLEGPFISPVEGARGAHDVRWIRPPDMELLRQMLDWAEGRVRMITVAAELEGIEPLIAYAAGVGVTVSLGHQMAGTEALKRAAGAGARALTHLGNGVPSLLNRHENPVWAGLGHDDLAALIITDGHHLPDALIQTFLRAKGVDRIIVTSDASPVAGLPPGRYETLNNSVVLDESGRLYNPQTGYMVGSSSTMIDCMNYLARLRLLSAEELVRVGCYNPLRLIGLDVEAVRPMRVVLFDEQAGRFAFGSGGEKEGKACLARTKG
jgi:N-acetylglucosamine-6-phosphate deacetylase